MTGIVLFLAGLIAFGQSAPKPQAFEVASIRPHQGPLRNIGGYSISGPRLSLEGYNEILLVMEAYNLKRYQLTLASPNVPVDDTFYDISAKAEGGGAPTRDEFRQMLQTLLADRFKLKFHREMRETPVYALVVGKNGPKLKTSAPDADPLGRVTVNGRNYVVTRPKATIDDVVSGVSGAFLDRPVLDYTGLIGTYDLQLTYTPDIPSNRKAEPDPDDISIFTAVQEQLGLKLEPRNAMVEILVLDHVEKPSDN